MDSDYVFVYLLCGFSVCAYQLVCFLTTKLQKIEPASWKLVN